MFVFNVLVGMFLAFGWPSGSISSGLHAISSEAFFKSATALSSSLTVM